MPYFPSSGQFGGGFSNPNFGGQTGANGNMWGGLPGPSFGGMSPMSGYGGAAQSPGQSQINQFNNDALNRQNQLMGMFKGMFGQNGQSGTLGSGMVDPTAAINAAQPGITRTMTGNMNEAASRMGDLGMLGVSNGKMAAGTPYADMLGQAAKEATDSTAEITNKYLYDAAKTNQAHQMDLMRLAGDWAQSGMFGSVNGGGSRGSSGGSSGGGSYGGSSGAPGVSGGVPNLEELFAQDPSFKTNYINNLKQKYLGGPR